MQFWKSSNEAIELTCSKIGRHRAGMVAAAAVVTEETHGEIVISRQANK